MFIEDLKPEDYVVTNKNQDLLNCIVKSHDEFYNEANNLIIEGRFLLHISDFSEDEYPELNGYGPIWFVFSKDEIPAWFSADKAQILVSRKNSEVKPSEPAPNVRNDNYKPDPLQGYNQDDSNMDIIKSVFNNYQEGTNETGDKEAKIYVFGSSKGGSGKTFTCLISARRYAITHPSERIAVADFDIIDGQVGISIIKTQPTMQLYWKNYQTGATSFESMKKYHVNSENFPSNIDFYLAPQDFYINNDEFWMNILDNLLKNYDTVFFDTGIDYVNYAPISYAYKIADRIVLTSTTSIKSVSSVLKQIYKLKGKRPSTNSRGELVYSADDNIGPKLRLAITGYNKEDRSNNTVIETFSKNIKISAVFGQYSQYISQAEYEGRWNIFDNNKKFIEKLDKLLDMDQ